MIIRKNTPLAAYAPQRGNEHIAQGNALGTSGKGNFRPEGAKALLLRALGFAFVRHDSAIQASLMALAAPSVGLSGR